jgi:heat shock protein HslJ
MNSRFASMAAVASMVALVAACGTTYPDYPGAPGSGRQFYAPMGDLTGTSWVLESGTPIPASPAPQPAATPTVQSGTVQATPAPAPVSAPTPWLLPDRGSRPTLRFSADQGSVTGATGCNTYFGTVHGSGNSISFGPLATTKMMCFDVLAVQEIQYLDMLSKVNSFSSNGGHLTLNTSDGRQLVFSQLVHIVGGTAETYNYVCDDGLYFSASYDPNAGLATIKLSTGATDTLAQQVAGSGVSYVSQRHSLRAKGNEAMLTTLYDGATHRCTAPLSPQG